MTPQWAIPPRYRAVAVLLACLLFFAEFIFITLRFQSKKLLDLPELAPWQKVFGYTGYFAQALVLAVMLYVFFRKDFVLAQWRRLVAGFSPARFARWLPGQALLYAAFVYASHLVFEVTLTSHAMDAWAAVAWLVCGCAVVALWMLGLAPASQWMQYFLHERRAFLLILPLTLAAGVMSLQSQHGWNSLADHTFSVSAWLLSLYGGDLVYVDASTKVVGLGNFAVSIAPQCSGYEGIGLVLTFTALYMLMNRRELLFPRALLLFPLGGACIWLLNCVRIAVLVIMGYEWSPAVAVGGFHSQAGWITFIATSIALLWVIDNSRLLRKSGQLPTAVRGANRPESDRAIATLVPLVVLLAATLLTSALASDFDYLYGLRVPLVGLALYKLWPLLRQPAYRPRWEAALAALLVALVWVGLLGFDAGYNAHFQAQLDAMPRQWAWLWLALRFAGAVLTVPIAEELAFRGYLLCRLSGEEVRTHGPLAPRLVAIAISSLAFGALHNAWLAGTFAGLVYAAVRLRTQQLGDAVLAHALTNALLFALALYGGYWNLL